MVDFKVKCPVCGKEAIYEGNPHRPFCCERCKLIDLGVWAGDGYKIPGGDTDDDGPGEDRDDDR